MLAVLFSTSASKTWPAARQKTPDAVRMAAATIAAAAWREEPPLAAPAAVASTIAAAQLVLSASEIACLSMVALGGREGGP
jgi:hypothetical protein